MFLIKREFRSIRSKIKANPIAIASILHHNAIEKNTADKTTKADRSLQVAKSKAMARKAAAIIDEFG